MLEIRTFSRILELDEYLCWNGLDCSKDLAREKKRVELKGKSSSKIIIFLRKEKKPKSTLAKKNFLAFLYHFVFYVTNRRRMMKLDN